MKWLPGPEVLFVLTALIFAPLGLAKGLAGASWSQTGCAFLIWFGLLGLLLGLGSSSKSEGLGWTLIMGMFFSWLGVPVVAIVLRMANFPA
jgi:hypothetical protein